MPCPKRACFVLTGQPVDAVLATPVGKWDQVVTPIPEQTAFTLYDTFDETLRRRPALLLQADHRLEYLRDDGSVASQTAERDGDFVADLADGQVRDALSGLSPLRSLIPIGSGQLMRSDLRLVGRGESTRAQASLRTLATGNGDSVTLAVLTRPRGHKKAMSRLISVLQRHGGVPLADIDLYATLFPDRNACVPRPDLSLTGKETAFDAANRIIATFIPVARQNEFGILGDIDTEFLHDYRIALRKIRSVVSLFKGVYSEPQTEDLKSRFSALMAETGPLRDHDVYLMERQKFYSLLPATQHPGLDQVFSVIARKRQSAFDTLTRHLRSEAYAHEVSTLRHLFETPGALEPGPNAAATVDELARTLLWKRYRKITGIADAIGKTTRDEEIHALRKHLKKLRYLMEIFGPLFPKDALKGQMKPMRRLQDNLGFHNDYSVQQVFLRGLIAEDVAGTAPRNAAFVESVEALIAVLHRRQQKERSRVVKNLARFNSPETRQTFRALFHGGKRPG